MGDLKNSRVWEIDFLRGTALVLMVFFHLIWDLNYFYEYPFDYKSGIYFFIGKTSAVLFISITAISCSFSRNNFKRGLQILAVAMGLTAATYIFNPNLFIVFGILHLLGISILLYPLLSKINNLILILLGMLILIIGQQIPQVDISTNILAPIGLRNDAFQSLDYYPLFPHLGVFIYGIVLSKIFYPKKQSLFNGKLPENPINFIGRHTLKVYILHQPVLLGVLFLLSKISLI